MSLVRNSRFWRAVLAEMIGSLFLVLFTSGSMSTLRGTICAPSDVVKSDLTSSSSSSSPEIDIISCPSNQTLYVYNFIHSCVTGVSAMSLSWIFYDVSGGHISPAVTAAMLTTRRVSLECAVIYLAAQCVGSLAACGILVGLFGSRQVGATVISPEVYSGRAFAIEFTLTFFYVFAFFATMDRCRGESSSASLVAFGGAVTIASVLGMKSTGASMNPARSLGPALVENVWDKHWIYWFGPLLGGSIGGLLFDLVFSMNASMLRARAFVNDQLYNADHFDSEEYLDRMAVLDKLKRLRTERRLAGQNPSLGSLFQEDMNLRRLSRATPRSSLGIEEEKSSGQYEAVATV